MFNSRDPLYRSPTGAVKKGTKVHFKITLPRNLTCSAALLIVEKDGGGKDILELFWCGMNGSDKEWWECHFTPEESGLYFYYFEARTNRGHMSLYKGMGGSANTSASGSRWQLTSYDEDYTTPDWLSGGLMYQIFPDRFFNSGSQKQHVPTDRKIHSEWGGQPDWKPDEKGKITNSDYFGGDIKGITQKLPYLKSLGVTCVYLNPIFEAHSNHRYDTADYSKIDPLLGSESDFQELCEKACRMGIRVIIDGVFSHTGSDSIYFNREGRYHTLGAYNSKESPYYPWYSFKNWPEEYDSWWNFDTLPNVKENNPEYSSYINGDSGIIRKWIQSGASGWRLDVADELPDEFIDSLRKAAKAENPESLILGEVWEDASNKSAYGSRRRYLLGRQLDTVMNYPFRDAILGFLNGEHSSLCMEKVETILENYPPQCIRLLMNHIGTHDTERALTVLAGAPPGSRGRDWQAAERLSKEQRETGVSKLRLASLLQFTLPGVPCIYYGDEAGMEGYRDPFNRGCYPWDNPDDDLISWYKRIAKLRHSHPMFSGINFRSVYAHGPIFAFERYDNNERLFIAVNRSDNNAEVPVKLTNPVHIMGANYSGDFKLPPYGFTVLKTEQPTQSD